MKMRKKKTGILLMILGLLLMLCGIVPAAGIPDGAEYIVRAPEVSREAPAVGKLEELDTLLEGMEWTAALKTGKGSARSESKGNTGITVYAVPEGYFGLRHQTLRAGRYISGADVKERLPAAVVTRKTAEDFFLEEDPAGRKLTCNNTELEIIGVVDGGTWIGEANEYAVYVPVSLADLQQLTPETMEIRVRTASDAEKSIAAANLRTWAPDGTFYNIARLKTTVWMPAWFLGTVFGFFLMIRAAGAVYRAERNLIGGIREKLKTCYFRECGFYCSGRAILGFAAGGLWLGGMFLLLYCAARPLYIYTDWIPEAFLDPASIAATARNLLRNASASVIYRSREVRVLELAASVSRFGSLVLTSGLAVFTLRNGRKDKTGKENLFAKT